MVNLIWTHTASEESVPGPASIFDELEVDSLLELLSELGVREVLSYLLHSFFLDAWMEGDHVFFTVV